MDCSFMIYLQAISRKLLLVADSRPVGMDQETQNKWLNGDEWTMEKIRVNELTNLIHVIMTHWQSLIKKENFSFRGSSIGDL